MTSSKSLLVPNQRLEAVRFKVERAVPLHDFRAVGWYQKGHEKYGEPFWLAETEKLALRRARVALPGPFDRMVAEAHEFWSEYEEINRRLLPDDPVYSKATTALTTATTNDIWEVGAAAATQLRIIESFIAGENVASTVARINVSRVTTQGTGTAPTAYTPEKYNTRSAAAASTVYGAISTQVVWGTAQATLAANPLLVHGLNTFGGSDRWVAQPGEELYMVNSEFVSMRSATGTPIISAYVVFEEL